MFYINQILLFMQFLLNIIDFHILTEEENLGVKIEKMHKIIQETKNLENQGCSYAAEEKIKELLPSVGALV